MTPQHAYHRNSMSRFLRRRANQAHPWQQSFVPIRLPTGPTPPLPVPAPRHRHLGSYTPTQFTAKKLRHLNLPDERTQLPHFTPSYRDTYICHKKPTQVTKPFTLRTYTNPFTLGTYTPTHLHFLPKEPTYLHFYPGTLPTRLPTFIVLG